MGTEIANIKVKGLKKGNPRLKSDTGMILPFFQNNKELLHLETMNRFIKATERLIRTSKEYKRYKAYLMEEIGLDHCMIFPDISDDGDAPIEMHHGPILTLYDICEILTNWMIANDIKITTFRVADLVIREHFDNTIQVVMLCEMAHQLVHANEIYLNPKQAWGDIGKFIEKYRDGIDDKQMYIIHENIRVANQYGSTDGGVLDVNPTVTDWSEK